MTKEALGELILSSERQLYATAKTILSDDQDCADAIQESIVKAFSKIDTLKKDRYAKTWLMRILINECYNIARRINVNEPLDEGYAENMKQPKENRDYSELYRAVNELKEELRIPVILYYMEEFNIREIAQILEISEGAVQKRLVRARKNAEKEDSIGGDFYMRLDELKKRLSRYSGLYSRYDSGRSRKTSKFIKHYTNAEKKQVKPKYKQGSGCGSCVHYCNINRCLCRNKALSNVP